MPALEALRIEEHHTLEEVYAFLTRTGIGDGLPVVPPTERRIEAMLGGRAPAEVIAVVEPAKGAATLRALAQCAVMAGCIPDQLPVLLAATRAVADPDFNLLGHGTTTGNTAVLLLVHGPMIQRLRFNALGNALGPGNHANATIGRALSLVLRNIGGAIPGKMDMATQGQPAKYTCCCAEHEAASPWGPFSATRGVPSGRSAVTVFAIAGMVEVVDSGSATAASMLGTLAHSMTIAGSLGGAGTLGSGEPLVLLAPEHAAIVARDMNRKQAQTFLWERARLPLEHLSEHAQERIRRARAENSQPSEGAVPVALRPEDIHIAVVGGPGQKSTYLPTWGGGTRAITRLVES
jgi:hypothetical protein